MTDSSNKLHRDVRHTHTLEEIMVKTHSIFLSNYIRANAVLKCCVCFKCSLFCNLCFSGGTHLVRRRHVASWLPHLGLRRLTQRRPSKFAVPFAKPAYETDGISLNKSLIRTILLFVI